MNELVEKNVVKIENMIYEVRGKQIMLDRDLAKLYQCVNGTKTINQAVKRHTNRFPIRFMFQITQEEYDSLWSQVGTANSNGNMSRTLSKEEYETRLINKNYEKKFRFIKN